VDLSEVFCECRTGFFFSPSRYACDPNAVAEPRRSSTHQFFAKNRKPLPEGWTDLKSDMFDKDNEEGDVEEVGDGGVEENSTESGPKLLDHFQGVFVNPRHRVPVGRRRQDSGDDESGSDPAQIDWLPGRHQWEWWRRLQQSQRS
jgi:hypothetical protein